jgi:hypothetical protein
VGTLKERRTLPETEKRSGFPKGGLFKNGRAPLRGQSVCHVSHGDDTAYVTAWKDKKRVLMLSNYAPSMVTCERKIRHGSNWTLQTLPRPNVVEHYNRSMCGTDLHDMRLAFVRSTVKSCRWQPRVFIDMFTSCMMNAFVLRKLHTAKKKNSKCTSFEFIAEYLAEIAPAAPAGAAPAPSEVPEHIHPAYDPKTQHVTRVKHAFWCKPAGTQFRLDGVGHYTQHALNVYDTQSGRKRADGADVRLNLRRNCRYCNTPTMYFCTKCETPLCVGHCFINFHTQSKLPKLPKSNRNIPVVIKRKRK